jgi:transposase-like protein
MEFMREFKDDDACLQWLWLNRFSPDGIHADCPKCEREGVVFRKYATTQRRQTWTCTQCGHHVQPTAGTIFEGSSTSLHLWFYAIHLMTSTRTGLSAKQLEREIGVTYKTAWRMLNLIRTELMEQDGDPLSGDVEVDETYYGGKPRAADIRRHRAAKYPQKAGAAWADKKKSTVFGMVERGGRVRAVVIPKDSDTTWKGTVSVHVLPASTIFTDEHVAYKGLEKTYAGHHRIRHSQNVYVEGNVHTNTIEGFFSLVKSGIRGTYHAVSRKWLPSYLNEYAWRYNARHDATPMFRQLLLRAARS